MIAMLRIALLTLCFWASNTWAFDLVELESQLKASPVVKGAFTQEKYLRALPAPLTSSGTFILSMEAGLLWNLQAPVAQTLRITPRGIDAKQPNGQWQPMSGTAGTSRQNALLLALIRGDTNLLLAQFEIALEGTAQQWKMTMKPRAALLRQIFDQLVIQGGERVQRIVLNETQGDYSVMTLHDTIGASTLQPEEARAYID